MDNNNNQAVAIVEHYRSNISGNGQYKGLPIYALPELHLAAADLLEAGSVTKGRVLDLASGSGAFALRLIDRGFGVECADLVGDGFALENVKFHQLNFNHDFCNMVSGNYDAITALEIIEHLENPRHFLRQCWNMLRPGGVLVLSTPNIENPRSVWRFITSGEFRQFGDEDYKISGHITPVSQKQLRNMIAENDWELLEFTSVGAPYGGGLRHIGAKIISLAMSANKCQRGAILLLALRKKP
jgi:2-polyprenyl-3-methyl-5-hydroxy-6-metoxy-1,4-benzoquinol methylase